MKAPRVSQWQTLLAQVLSARRDAEKNTQLQLVWHSQLWAARPNAPNAPSRGRRRHRLATPHRRRPSPGHHQHRRPARTEARTVTLPQPPRRPAATPRTYAIALRGGSTRNPEAAATARALPHLTADTGPARPGPPTAPPARSQSPSAAG